MSYDTELEHSARSTISLCFGAASMVLLPLGALGTKYGLWSHNIGIIMVALAFLAALVPAALFIGFVWHPRYRADRRGLFAGIMMGLLPLMVAAYLFSSSGSAPIIHDISTDTIRPPQFLTAVKLRAPDDNSLQWQEDVAKAQRQAYGGLTSVESSLSAAQAYDQAKQVILDLGWEIIDSDSRPGFIEAVDTSFWFGFKDDIVIRIEPAPGGSVLDLRSASRVGRGDLGANATRIKLFIERFAASQRTRPQSPSY